MEYCFILTVRYRVPAHSIHWTISGTATTTEQGDTRENILKTLLQRAEEEVRRRYPGISTDVEARCIIFFSLERNAL